MRAREREWGSKRREVMGGGKEERGGLGSFSLEAWTTTIRKDSDLEPLRLELELEENASGCCSMHHFSPLFVLFFPC